MKSDSIRINRLYGEKLKVDVSLNAKICVFTGLSGTGKTYLISILADFARKNKLKYAHINYVFDFSDKDRIVSYCEGCDLVLLDNADLYLTDNLMKRIISNCGKVVVAIHEPTFVPMCSCDDAVWYRVNYGGNKLTVTGGGN